MSKSLARVVVALPAAGCDLSQIVKSMFLGIAWGAFLFLTAGSNQVEVARAGV